MKTAEEIKKGLECSIAQTDGRCEEYVACVCCPYFSENPSAEDTLAYIQQLEAAHRTEYCEEADYDCKALGEARKRIAELEAQVPKWICVEERLPENDANYLVFTSAANEVDLATYYGDGEWLAPDLCNLTRFVTHWMPLPEAPKEG